MLMTFSLLRCHLRVFFLGLQICILAIPTWHLYVGTNDISNFQTPYFHSSFPIVFLVFNLFPLMIAQSFQFLILDASLSLISHMPNAIEKSLSSKFKMSPKQDHFLSPPLLSFWFQKLSCLAQTFILCTNPRLAFPSLSNICHSSQRCPVKISGWIFHGYFS